MMPKRFGVILAVLIVASLAGCGGNEPAPTPTPLATVTPTATLTPRPSATATRTATATATPPVTSTATESPTVTPTTTDTPAEMPTEMPTATPVVTTTETATQTTTAALTETVMITQTVAVTQTVITTQTAVLTATDAESGGFTSPLAAPNSPLAVPPPPTATPSAPSAALMPVTGSWQLQAIRPAAALTYTIAPAGYRIAFGPTGVVRVMADCKTGRGRYTSTADGALSVAITYSDVRCAPDSLADPFGQALSQVTAYRFDGDRLILLYGVQGGEMSLARTPQMSPLGAPFLSWSTLQNSTFFVPSVPAGDNQSPLVDGEFRALLTPASAAVVAGQPAAPLPAETPVPGAAQGDEFVVSLSTMHTYGVLVTPSPEEIAADPEITAEVSIDTVAVLVIENGAAAPQSYLAPVLNGGGLPLPLQMELLGDNVLVRDLRWDGVRLAVDYEQEGKTLRHVYHFDENHFVLDSEEELPPIPLKARLDLPAQAVTLGPLEGAAAGTGQTSLTGVIATGEIHPYRLALAAGQTLSVTVQSAYDNIWLSIFGRQDRTVLRSIRSDAAAWSGSVPSSQEYLISAVAPGSGSPYTLTIQASPGAQASAPVAPAAPAPTPEGKVVHLVIDGAALDGAGVAAPVLLDLLQRNNAGVDFFLDAAQVAQTGSAAAAAVGGGHGVGLIAGPIRALTSDERDALFVEVGGARQALGEPAARCLRLPAAAGDAYTRAAAAELGFEVVQWDIDATGVTGDNLQSVLGGLFPGAVVRLDAGDGSSLVAALQTLLPALAQGGYSVQAMCR